MSERDDLFLEALDEDADLAWRLAAATERPAPPRLREAIVGPRRRAARTRRITLWSGGIRWAYAAVTAVVLLVLVALASGGRVVALAGAGDVSGRATLVATPGGDGYLILALPSPPSGKTYEAWVIRGGEPLPAGLASGNGIVALSAGALRSGDVVAITVEASGGVTRPTGAPILAAKL